MEEVTCIFCSLKINPTDSKAEGLFRQVLELKDENIDKNCFKSTCLKCFECFRKMHQAQQKAVHQYEQVSKMRSETISKMREMDKLLENYYNHLEKFGMSVKTETDNHGFAGRINQIATGVNAYRNKLEQHFKYEQTVVFPSPDDLIDNYASICHVSSTTAVSPETDCVATATRTSARNAGKKKLYCESASSCQGTSGRSERKGVKRGQLAPTVEVKPAKISLLDPKLKTAKVNLKRLEPSEIPKEPSQPSTSAAAPGKKTQIIYFGDTSSEEDEDDDVEEDSFTDVSADKISEIAKYKQAPRKTSTWEHKTVVGLLGHMAFVTKEAEKNQQNLDYKLTFQEAKKFFKYGRATIGMHEDSRTLLCLKCRRGEAFRTAAVESNFKTIFDQITDHIKEEHFGSGGRGANGNDEEDNENWAQDGDLWLNENSNDTPKSEIDSKSSVVPSDDDHLAKIDTEIVVFNKSPEGQRALQIIKKSGKRLVKNCTAVAKCNQETGEILVLNHPVRYEPSSKKISCSLCVFQLGKKTPFKEMIVHVLRDHAGVTDFQGNYQEPRFSHIELSGNTATDKSEKEGSIKDNDRQGKRQTRKNNKITLEDDPSKDEEELREDDLLSV